MTDEQRHWLERKVEHLDALYRKYGRQGLNDIPLTDIQLLLQSKELRFRDCPRGNNLAEAQKAETRLLEMEITDLRAHVRGYIAGLGGGQAWKSRDWVGQGQQQSKPQERDQNRGGRGGR